MKKMGILGPRGTHSEAAAVCLNKILPEKFELVICADIFEILQKVELGKLDSGFVPVENSLEGSINVTLDTLARSHTLTINREFVWKIHNHLMTKPEVKISEVKKIFSHSQPISQCRRYLQKNFSDVEFIITPSTARAAEIVAESSPAEGFAAICSERAGELYNLKILAEEIQDNKYNSTRFFEISQRSENFDENDVSGDKVSLVCMVDGSQSGALYSVLKEFAVRKINMTHIESRPARLELGEYIFFFDLETKDIDKKIFQESLEAVREKSIWLKNLGTFPVINPFAK